MVRMIKVMNLIQRKNDGVVVRPKIDIPLYKLYTRSIFHRLVINAKGVIGASYNS